MTLKVSELWMWSYVKGYSNLKIWVALSLTPLARETHVEPIRTGIEPVPHSKVEASTKQMKDCERVYACEIV